MENDKVLYVMAGEYYSGAASATTVYGWGSNDYLCTGVGRNNPVQELKSGRDRGNVMQPAKVCQHWDSREYCSSHMSAAERTASLMSLI